MGWDASHQATAANLTGLRPEQARGTQIERLWARDRLVERMNEEIAALEKHRETLDLGLIDLDREAAAEVAPFDTSREAILARRYESEARRGFFKALQEFRRVEAEAEMGANVEVEASDPSPEVAPLASCREPAAPAPRVPQAGPMTGLVRPTGTVDGAARGLDGRVLAVGRATFAGG